MKREAICEGCRRKITISKAVRIFKHGGKLHVCRRKTKVSSGGRKRRYLCPDCRRDLIHDG